MTGAAEYVVVVDDEVRPVEMYPPLRPGSVAPEELHLGLEEIRVSEPTALPILVDLGVYAVASPYRILGSVSGTAPSAIFAGVSMPLARDRFFDFTESWAVLRSRATPVSSAPWGARRRAWTSPQEH